MTVRVESITKRFGPSDGAAAVSEASFEARAGEITTLLRVVAGLEEPDSGRVLVDGRDVTRVSPRERNVGFVFHLLRCSWNIRVWRMSTSQF